MNTIEIYNIIDLEYQDWIDVGFGKWIHGIFLRGGDKVFTFDEQKESFFYLLKKLLDDNKVVLFAPYSNWTITVLLIFLYPFYEVTISPVFLSIQPIPI
jgi:hypothetical protein